MYRIWIGIFGFHLGSFLLCMCHGYLKKRYTLRSCCDGCHHVLCWNDLIPILSYIFLKGKCRYCGRKLSKEYIVAEILTGILCVLVLWDIHVIEWEVIVRMILFLLLWVVFYIDYQIMEIPDFIHLSMIVLYIIHACMIKKMDIQPWIRMAILFGFGTLTIVMSEKVFGKECIGGGDVKLISCMSLFLSFQKLWLVLSIASFLAILWLCLSKKKCIAFGPFLAIAFLLVFCGYFDSAIWGL